MKKKKREETNVSPRFLGLNLSNWVDDGGIYC